MNAEKGRNLPSKIGGKPNGEEPAAPTSPKL
jgi:hypothetical protein